MNNQTLKDLTVTDLEWQPLWIKYPTLDVTFEPKSSVTHLLPIFIGLVGEDPNMYLKEFHVVYSNMKPIGVIEEQVKLRVFPFSLENNANEWLYYLLYGLINNWSETNKKFMERYFPASIATVLRNEICGIKKYSGETLFEYWERFKGLWPVNHNIKSMIIFYSNTFMKDFHLLRLI